LPRRFAPRRRGHRSRPGQGRARPREPRAAAHGPRQRLQGRPLTRLSAVRGIRGRLALAVVGLVVLTVSAIGVGTYLFVDARLRDGLVAEAERQAQFNLSVLVPQALPDGVTRDGLQSANLAAAFRLRGDVEAIVDFHDGASDWVSTATLDGASTGFANDLRAVIDARHLAYGWFEVDGAPSLVVGGHPSDAVPGTAAPVFYFVFPAGSVETALAQLRLGLLAA